MTDVRTALYRHFNATGSLLLAQFIDLQRAMEGQGEIERLAAMLREAA